jgi:CDP-4-dehydro-6-deoxyglucose reductase, E1
LYGDAVYHLPYIPCSGKMLDAADLRNMVDASLDMWLTAGRFCEDFERKLANRFGTAHAVMTVSGSAANLLAFTARPDRNESGFPRHAGGASLTH